MNINIIDAIIILIIFKKIFANGSNLTANDGNNQPINTPKINAPKINDVSLEVFKIIPLF